ncbi:Regulator of chromosome condensation [Trypanosoma melophagium]|uniref:Regulator of chromosome condensation n=1 Tax=Trypanosoma melophagium TaxID=715481 RepID=UPI00351A9092|nr:Regulator of chromosome condensation [Trypanosoma melophagium]
MISDAEFWMEARRNQERGNAIFTAMLPLLHSRQVALDSGVEVNEGDTDFTSLSSSLKRSHKQVSKEPYPENKIFHVPGSNAPHQPVSVSVIRVLQQVMMFAVPLYTLRYSVPAMSMGTKTSCVVDRLTKQLITFGAGDGVKVPHHLRCRGCVAADGFFAILTDQDEVWASGGLIVLAYEGGSWTSVPLGKEEIMTNVAGKALMLVGHGSRLACVTRAFTVRPLSIVSNPVRSIIPFRHVRFLDLGYGEDYYMVGADSVLYKTIASKRLLGTPRRVMALSRTAISRIACGMGFCLIIDQNGHLYTLGRNKKGQLGNGQLQNVRRRPYLHTSLIHHFFVMVAAGEYHSLALSSSGVVYGAGSNEHGQLGLGESVKESVRFTAIPLPSLCVGIAAGPEGSMFACEDGRLYACGKNNYNQLGVESSDPIVCVPSLVSAVATGVEAYTMDFGAYRRPQINDQKLNEVPEVPNPSPVTLPTRDSFQDTLNTETQPIPETEAPMHPATAPYPEQRKVKKGACAKCCMIM